MTTPSNTNKVNAVVIVGNNNFYYYYGEDVSKEEAIDEVLENLKDPHSYDHNGIPEFLEVFEVVSHQSIQL